MSIRMISDELTKIANRELNEVPNRIADDIQHMRKWLLKQPHLKSRTDDQWILTFLRGCKFSLQKAKDKMEAYYTMRSAVPELFTNRDPLLPEIQEILNLGLCLPLMATDESEGPRTLLIHCDGVDPVKISFTTLVKVSLMIIDILMNEDDNFVIRGQHGLINLKEMNMSHMIHMNINNICKKVTLILHTAYPTRLKSIHLINAPFFIDKLFKIFTRGLPKKIIKRICIYNNDDPTKVFSVLPSSILPKDYGGLGLSKAQLIDHWKKKVESYRDWFLEDERNYFCDETKRIHPFKFDSELFGVEGSFRKLNID